MTDWAAARTQSSEVFIAGDFNFELLGLVRPTSGVIKFPVRASSWEYLRARSRIGAIIETPAFYENT